MYAIIKHGQVLNTGTLEQMFISNIFPLSDTPEWKEEHDVYEVVYPSYDPQTHYLVSATPTINGRQVVLHQATPIPPQPEPQPQLESEPEPESIEVNLVGADSNV